ncbi:hypothetical protein TeGR_g4408, partial [Tetraparma gracilis]
ALGSSQQLLWSAHPLTAARLTSVNTWEDIPDTSVSLTLPNEAPLLVSYTLAARALKPESSTMDFIMDTTMSLGQKDFLQARVLVDGIPFRASASHAPPSSSLEAAARSLQASFVVPLGAGPHTLTLQWKRRGEFVTSWACAPSLHDGFAAGRMLAADANHRYLWSALPTSDAVVSESGAWRDMPDSAVSFTLPEPATLRFLYSMTVRPDYISPTEDFGRSDELSARLVIDGSAYRETGASTSVTARSYGGARLGREIVLDLQARDHTVQLQWRKWGNYERVWRSAPSFLDGYASSRSLIVHGERRSIQAVQNLDYQTIATSGSWHAVSDKVLTFSLPAPATVLFSYGLPVTQMGSPTLDGWTYQRWSEIGARLLVDARPYASSGSSQDGVTDTFDELKGQLMLSLAAGTHTAILQWRVLEADDAVTWTTLNRVVEGYQGAEELLVLVNQQSSEPQVVLPAANAVPEFEEDTAAAIEGAFIAGVPPDLESSYRVGVTVSSTFGVVSLPTTRNLVFGAGDGTEDSTVYFSGAVSAVNAALASITYKPLLNRFGDETLSIAVKDLMYLGANETHTDAQDLSFTVASVNDPPTIMSPATQTVTEDGHVSVLGVSVFDADVISAANSLYKVTVSCDNGKLTLHSSSASATVNTTTPAAAVYFEGTLDEINSLVQQIIYQPNPHYNDLHPTSE